MLARRARVPGVRFGSGADATAESFCMIYRLTCLPRKETRRYADINIVAKIRRKFPTPSSSSVLHNNPTTPAVRALGLECSPYFAQYFANKYPA